MRQAQKKAPDKLGAEVRAARLAAIAAKDREYHRRVAAHYDRAITDIYAIYHRFDLDPWVAAVAARHPNGLALDVGAGTGVVADVLAAAGFRVWAIDHSEDMLKVARRRSESRPRPFSLLQGDVVRLPFREATFDVVTMQGILHHVPLALDEVIAQASRVLRPGGEFYIAEPCDGLSLVGRILRSPLWFRPYDPNGEETDEEALVWEPFSHALKAAGLEYTAKFLTHIPSAHFHYWLPAEARIAITRLLSFPFKRGDLLFVHGQKPR